MPISPACPACRWRINKIGGNRARDLRVENALRSMGWHVVTIWACALKSAKARLWLEPRLEKLLGAPSATR